MPFSWLTSIRAFWWNELRTMVLSWVHKYNFEGGHHNVGFHRFNRYTNLALSCIMVLRSCSTPTRQIHHKNSYFNGWLKSSPLQGLCRWEIILSCSSSQSMVRSSKEISRHLLLFFWIVFEYTHVVQSRVPHHSALLLFTLEIMYVPLGSAQLPKHVCDVGSLDTKGYSNCLFSQESDLLCFLSWDNSSLHNLWPLLQYHNS